MQFLGICCAILSTAVPISALATDTSGTEPQSASKEEYIACLENGDAIEAKKARLVERERKHKELAAKFRAADASLTEQVKRHTPSTKAEISSYNKAVETRNANAASFNLEARAIQQEHAMLNRQVVETNTKCDGLLVSREAVQGAEQQRKRRGAQPE